MNIWLYVDGADELLYSSTGNDFAIALLDRTEKLRIPVTFVIDDAVHIFTNQDACIEFDYLLNKMIEQETSGFEPFIPLDQMENWRNSSISEKESDSNEKYNTTEYWHYLQTNVSDYARSVQLENEQLYRDVDVAGVSAVFAQFDSIPTDTHEVKSANLTKNEEIIAHLETKPTQNFVQESMQMPIPEQYTSPNKTFRQEEMVEVFSYAKKEEDKGIFPSTFEPVKAETKIEIAQGQSEKTTRDVNVAGISNAVDTV